MRSKQEIITFLESKIGIKVPCKGNPSLDGQCVTLIKALMEFLGIPDPYKARGNANSCISQYLTEGIADKGVGWLSVFSSKTMAGGTGHIWCNAGDGNGTYYESNGQRALHVTRGKTYTYDTVCNFDKYISDISSNTPSPQEGENGGKESMTLEQLAYFSVTSWEDLLNKTKENLGETNGRCDWGAQEDDRGGFLGAARRECKAKDSQIKALQEQLATGNKLSPVEIPTEKTIGGKTMVINGASVDSEGKIIGNYKIKGT